MNIVPIHPQIDVLCEEDHPGDVLLVLHLEPSDIQTGVGPRGTFLQPIHILLSDGPVKDALHKLAENPDQWGYGVTRH
jgi:hypothetical protein